MCLFPLVKLCMHVYTQAKDKAMRVHVGVNISKTNVIESVCVSCGQALHACLYVRTNSVHVGENVSKTKCNIEHVFFLWSSSACLSTCKK
jgi:hypothetical protein